MGKTHQSINIEKPVDQVWQSIRDFHEMSWAPNVVTNLEVVGDTPADQPGAVRVLNGSFHETLLEFDDRQRTMAYSIDDGPSPISKDEISNYVGRVRVQPTDSGGTLVEWSSTWEGNDEPAYAFCHLLYVALLEDMKKSLE